MVFTWPKKEALPVSYGFHVEYCQFNEAAKIMKEKADRINQEEANLDEVKKLIS